MDWVNRVLGWIFWLLFCHSCRGILVKLLVWTISVFHCFKLFRAAMGFCLGDLAWILCTKCRLARHFLFSTVRSHGWIALDTWGWASTDDGSESKVLYECMGSVSSSASNCVYFVVFFCSIQKQSPLFKEELFKELWLCRINETLHKQLRSLKGIWLKGEIKRKKKY